MNDRIVMPQEAVECIAASDPPAVQLSKDEQDRIAHLSMLLAQNAARKAGAIDVDVMPYRERPENARAAMRRGVVRVIQALHMLGYLDVPAK